MSHEFKLLGHDCRYHSSDEEPDRGYHRRHWLTVGNAEATLEVEIPSHAFGVSVKLKHPSEGELGGHIGIGIGAVFARLSHPLLGALCKKAIALLPTDMDFQYGGREFALRFHDHAVWWSLGVDDMGWASKRPRWRDGAWHPLGYQCRQCDPVVIEEREVLVPMPERSYRGRAKRTKASWGFDRLPAFTHKTLYSYEIEMLPGEQIPFPGKGENSWDCDEDAAFSFSGRGQTIEDGVGAMAASVLRSRRRHGGPAWRPAKTEKISA